MSGICSTYYVPGVYKVYLMCVIIYDSEHTSSLVLRWCREKHTSLIECVRFTLYHSEFEMVLFFVAVLVLRNDAANAARINEDKKKPELCSVI